MPRGKLRLRVPGARRASSPACSRVDTAVGAPAVAVAAMTPPRQAGKNDPHDFLLSRVCQIQVFVDIRYQKVAGSCQTHLRIRRSGLSSFFST